MGLSEFHRRFLALLCLGCVISPLLPWAPAQADGVASTGTVVPAEYPSKGYIRPAGTYRLQFIAVAWNDYVPRVTEDIARSATSVLDSAFNEATRGRYRMSFESLTRTRWSGTSDDCKDLPKFASAASAGIADVPNGIKVFLVACGGGPIGEQPGNKVVLSDLSATTPQADFSTLTHEVGHNLGLYHAGGMFYGYLGTTPATRQNPYQTWVPEMDIEVYADRGSVMGNDWGARPTFSAYERDQLGAYTAAEVGAALESGVFTVTERGVGNGLRILYIPSGNVRQAAVEFWRVSPEVTKKPRDGAVIRALFNGAERGSWAANLRDGNALLQPSTADYRDLALRVGERIDLPDQTSIVLEKLDDLSATVRVTRPVDKSAPVFDSEMLPCGAKPSCTLGLGLSRKTGTWELSVDDVVEDRWLGELGVNINGKPGPKFTHPSPSTPQLWTQVLRSGFGVVPITLGAGKYELEFFATDAAGNRTSTTRTVTLLGQPTAPKQVTARATSASSARVSWSASGSVEAVKSFRISYRTSFGSWRTAGTVPGNQLQFTLRGLSRGTTYFVSVTPINDWGPGLAGLATLRMGR